MDPILLDLEPDPVGAEAIRQGLRDFNDAHCPLSAERRKNPNDLAQVQVLARDPDGTPLGGAIGKVWTAFRWLEVEILFVREPLRGRGLGTRLMDEIEEEGRRRGCTRVRIGTWDFQALKFYQRRGYQIYSVLPNFPEGNTDYQLWKEL